MIPFRKQTTTDFKQSRQRMLVNDVLSICEFYTKVLVPVTRKMISQWLNVCFLAVKNTNHVHLINQWHYLPRLGANVSIYIQCNNI